MGGRSLSAASAECVTTYRTRMSAGEGSGSWLSLFRRSGSSPARASCRGRCGNPSRRTWICSCPSGSGVMGDGLASAPWNDADYQRLIDASLRDGELVVHFANGDVIEVDTDALAGAAPGRLDWNGLEV